MAKALARKKSYLCIYGPKDGQWISLDEGLKLGYKQFNRAYGWGEPKKLTAVLVFNAELQIKAGLKW